MIFELPMVSLRQLFPPCPSAIATNTRKSFEPAFSDSNHTQQYKLETGASSSTSSLVASSSRLVGLAATDVEAAVTWGVVGSVIAVVASIKRGLHTDV